MRTCTKSGQHCFVSHLLQIGPLTKEFGLVYVSYRRSRVPITFEILGIDGRTDTELLKAVMYTLEYLKFIVDPWWDDPENRRWRLGDRVERGELCLRVSEASMLEIVPMLQRLHPMVKYFASRFASEASAKHPLNQTPATPSRQELGRFMCALYRFETFCTLFRERNTRWWMSVREISEYELETQMKEATKEDGSWGEWGEWRWRRKLFPELNLHLLRMASFFWPSYTVWECEQVYCINDLLVAALRPAYDEIAEHNITLGSLGIAWGEDNNGKTCGIHGLLVAGLERTYQFLDAETYEAKERILFCDEEYPIQQFFLAEIGREVSSYFLLGREKSMSLIPILKVPEAGADRDPEYIWRAALDERDPTQYSIEAKTVNSWRNCGMRQLAYVMWDRSRLEPADITRQVVNVVPGVPNLERKRKRLFDKNMEKSWHLRIEAFILGGRGRYSPEKLEQLRKADEEHYRESKRRYRAKLAAEAESP